MSNRLLVCLVCGLSLADESLSVLVAAPALGDAGPLYLYKQYTFSHCESPFPPQWLEANGRPCFFHTVGHSVDSHFHSVAHEIHRDCAGATLYTVIFPTV